MQPGFEASSWRVRVSEQRRGAVAARPAAGPRSGPMAARAGRSRGDWLQRGGGQDGATLALRLSLPAPFAGGPAGRGHEAAVGLLRPPGAGAEPGRRQTPPDATVAPPPPQDSAGLGRARLGSAWLGPAPPARAVTAAESRRRRHRGQMQAIKCVVVGDGKHRDEIQRTECEAVLGSNWSFHLPMLATPSSTHLEQGLPGASLWGYRGEREKEPPTKTAQPY
ncbi:ras-related C3 botulinum toxin substrate 3 isoform X3 [Falco rusticolus]|uniref:ras-related C3 botulinum toxin substrate 3 isoform X3 n=1 Tax=Falco rusticolus TaxID=120794 RepID=UPI001886710D|nr:ras-related C3 botulinum toxin substrate 3 isoform X3 [Falco rusticolus]